MGLGATLVWAWRCLLAYLWIPFGIALAAFFRICSAVNRKAVEKHMRDKFDKVGMHVPAEDDMDDAIEMLSSFKMPFTILRHSLVNAGIAVERGELLSPD